MSGWTTCTAERSISWWNSWRDESHSPAAIGTGDAAASRAYPSMSSVHSGVSRKKMSYSAICSATRRARSTVSNAYCASTISVMSGPAAARTSRATCTTHSSGPDSPLCA